MAYDNLKASVPENSPEVLLARKYLNFTGPSSQLENFLSANPAAAARMGKYRQAMVNMSNRSLGMAEGGSASAKALELMKQGKTAEAMAMMKSGVGLDSKLTSNDALQYLKKTGDQSGAEQILQSSVGLPTSTNTTTGSDITGSTQPFNQNQQQTLGTYNTGQPQATTQPQTAEMQQFNQQMQSNVAGENAGTTQPQSTPQPQEQTAEMQQFNQQMQGAVSGTTQPQSTTAAVAADQPTGDQQQQKAIAEQQKEIEKQLEQTAKSLVDDGVYTKPVEEVKRPEDTYTAESLLKVKQTQEAYRNSDTFKNAQAAVEKIQNEAIAELGLPEDPNTWTQEQMDAANKLFNSKIAESPEVKAAKDMEDQLNVDLGKILDQGEFDKAKQNLISETMSPVQSDVEKITVDEDKEILGDEVGQVDETSPEADVSTVDTVEKADEVVQPDTEKYEADLSAEKVAAQTEALEAAKIDPDDPRAKVTAAQTTKSAVSDLKAAQGTAHQFDNEIQRELDNGELVSGSAVDAVKAAKFTEQIQAAEATPTEKATVQGQLDGLMQDFEGGKTPAWAAGAMRAATAAMAARGLGASSMAGQAIVQAAMESAIPIAQADAATVAAFESQNLSNRQQRAMLAAEQRAAFMQLDFSQEFQARVLRASTISDIANMNFTADQQVQLENARFAQTMNIENLNAQQGLILAEAAALSSLDLANLNNRQQAAVQNAQNFLQMSMLNTTNEQQTEIFKTQQNIQSLFTDSAATNAASQFNASSENQMNQFFANLTAQVSQFNAAQTNSIAQFNAQAENIIEQFNQQLQQQRDFFNANNGLVVAQANAQWRQNVSTLNTAAQNESNMDYAKTINALTSTNLDNIWQRERDIMSFMFTAQQSQLDRALNLLLGDKKLEQVEMELNAAEGAAKTSNMFRFLFGDKIDGIFDGII